MLFKLKISINLNNRSMIYDLQLFKGIFYFAKNLVSKFMHSIIIGFLEINFLGLQLVYNFQKIIIKEKCRFKNKII